MDNNNGENLQNVKNEQENEALRLNEYLLERPAPESAPFVEKDKSRLIGIWVRIGVLVLILVTAFVGAFSGMAYICRTSVFSDSTVFDAFIAKWSGVVENRIEVDKISGDYESDTIALADKVLNTSVRIRVVAETASGALTETSAGSGIIYAKGVGNKYTVITNHHVVYGSKSFVIETYDGERYDGKIKHLDEISDVAVVEFECSKELSVARQGDSSKIKAGQNVIVAGNPLGGGFGVSFGYISNPEKISTANNNIPLTVLDVSVNPGNSGGGVYDAQGNLIGLVVSKASGTDVDGIGYAVPINTVNSVVNDLVSLGYVRGRPALGVTVIGIYNDNVYAEYMEGELKGYLLGGEDRSYGVFILESQNSSLKKGDRIVKVDGDLISISTDIRNAIMDKKPDSVIKVTVERGTEDNGTVKYQQYTLDILLIERTFIDENK